MFVGFHNPSLSQHTRPYIASLSGPSSLIKPEFPYLRIPDNIQQADNVWPSCEILQYFNLALDLLLLDGLEDLDNALLAVDDVHALEDLRVLASADLADNLIVILNAVSETMRCVWKSVTKLNR
ncbi:hypothetical protein BC938DRAFT_477744 [Jimgerdemannia flammicorona]|uniref:Uncharacterized protein n=1 Tax=Jimgerdemannia flammicorona TaxID=994334 RepID=A0A433P7Y7_9FUNG|nr:hypothetical protein BC938DRAFT_477744 [Jimgerdemannia flammicorona]